MKKRILNRHVTWPSNDGDIRLCDMTDSHILFVSNKLLEYAKDRTNYRVNGLDTFVGRTEFTIREWLHALQREQKQRLREIKNARSAAYGMAAKKTAKNKNLKRRFK